MSLIRNIIGYATSREYVKLAELMQRQSVVCIVVHHTCRDVAHTFYDGSTDLYPFAIRARGIEYVCGRDAADFIDQCTRAEVEWLVPATL
jgi:hypothetical protein